MTQVFACLDAAYTDGAASAACALFPAWDAASPLQVVTARQGAAAEYEPGAFYKRELPLLLAVLGRIARVPATIVVDGYVWLEAGKPGLGARLHEALEGRACVVGVAKSAFAGATAAIPVLRGGSRSPLYVSAAGLDVSAAAEGVRSMHGRHRIPTLLRLVDRAARDALS
jgi:deoxyribonuclease V